MVEFILQIHTLDDSHLTHGNALRAMATRNTDELR